MGFETHCPNSDEGTVQHFRAASVVQQVFIVPDMIPVRFTLSWLATTESPTNTSLRARVKFGCSASYTDWRSMNVRGFHRMLTVAAIAGCSSCAPLNPSAQDVLGRWQVQCEEGGTETLELSPQSRYTYTFESPRRKERVEGTWDVRTRTLARLRLGPAPPNSLQCGSEDIPN
jgi:hypothetical protein